MEKEQSVTRRSLLEKRMNIYRKIVVQCYLIGIVLKTSKQAEMLKVIKSAFQYIPICLPYLHEWARPCITHSTIHTYMYIYNTYTSYLHILCVHALSILLNPKPYNPSLYLVTVKTWSGDCKKGMTGMARSRLSAGRDFSWYYAVPSISLTIIWHIFAHFGAQEIVTQTFAT